MKLSDYNLFKIMTSRTPFGYTKEEIDNMVYMKENDTIDGKKDMAFIFGNPNLFPYRADKAIDLYGKEEVSKLIVSGGIGRLNKDRKTPEAYKMRDYLMEKGIPEKDIIVEDKSTTTIQNIQNTFKIISSKSKYDLNKIKWVLISNDFHIRRCLGLFSKELGHTENITYSGVKDGFTDLESWDKNRYGKQQILVEALALCLYAKKGIIDNYEIDNSNLENNRLHL